MPQWPPMPPHLQGTVKSPSTTRDPSWLKPNAQHPSSDAPALLEQLQGGHFGVWPCDSPSAQPGGAQPVPNTLAKSCARQLLPLCISQHPETATVGPCSPLYPAELGKWVPVPATSQGVTQVPWPQAAPSRDNHPAVPGTWLHPAPLPVYLIPHTETPMFHGQMYTPGCPMYPGKVPSQSHVSPVGDPPPAPQCPAGVTTTQGPSFSVHSWPCAASTHCHVHTEWCRNVVQENSAGTWHYPISRWICGDGY